MTSGGSEPRLDTLPSPTRVDPELSLVESTIRQLCRCRLDPIKP